MHDPNALDGQTEDLVGHLGQGRFQPLAVALDADAQLEAAVRRHPGDGLLESRHHRYAPSGVDGGPVRALLTEDRATEADPLGSPRVALTSAHGRQIDRSHGPAKALRIVAAVEVLARDVVERHGLGRDEVP